MIILITYYTSFVNPTLNLLTQLIAAIILGVVYSSIQKFTIILTMKPIIFISIMSKYLNISIYLDNLTPLYRTSHMCINMIDEAFLPQQPGSYKCMVLHEKLSDHSLNSQC